MSVDVEENGKTKEKKKTTEKQSKSNFRFEDNNTLNSYYCLLCFHDGTDETFVKGCLKERTWSVDATHIPPACSPLVLFPSRRPLSST